jgi:hypothetical protein
LESTTVRFNRLILMPLDHYISQVHLRNFYSPVLIDRMYTIRKSDLKAFTPNSDSVCRVLDGSTNAYLKDTRAIEDFLKGIEPNYNASLQKLITSRIDNKCIYTIAGFAAYIAVCSPAGMRIFSDPLRSIVEMTLEQIDSQGLLPIPPTQLNASSTSELLKRGDIDIRIDPKYPQALGIDSILKNTALFGNFEWEILSNDFNDSPFFTSDFPIALEKTADPRILNRIIPLAPNLAVRIKPNIMINKSTADLSFSNFRHRICKINREEVRKINYLIVRSAEDNVFFRDNLPWIEKFVVKNRYYHIEIDSQKMLIPGGQFIYSAHKIVEKIPLTSED